MLSMINILKEYKDNKKKFLSYLSNLDKKEILNLYIEIRKYKETYLFKEITKETLKTLIDIELIQILKHVENVLPIIEYKGKKPKNDKKNISKIAEQLDKEGKY